MFARQLVIYEGSAWCWALWGRVRMLLLPVQLGNLNDGRWKGQAIQGTSDLAAIWVKGLLPLECLCLWCGQGCAKGIQWSKCMCVHVHSRACVMCRNLERGGSLHKRAPVGSFKNFSPDTMYTFYLHCCRANKVSPVSVADFIDQWMGRTVCGKSMSSGAKLLLILILSFSGCVDSGKLLNLCEF